jgi:drug/metabolite transporter (DMT)-like permease
MPHAQPLTFLVCRYGLSALLFTLWARAAGVAWPQGRRQWLHLALVGTLIQGGYLGGVWCAVKAGLGAGLVALIVGLQPVLTALWVNSRGNGPSPAQRVLPLQWLGLALGLSGLLLVVWQKLHVGEAQAHTVALACIALLSITVGTLYQKRWVRACDVRSANTVQLLAAFAVTLPLALLEPWQFDPHPDLFIALAWSVLVLTLGGSSLLSLLIQRGAATAVTSLMYLVPPCTAVMAWWLFSETLTAAVFAGLALTAAGVALVVRQSPSSVPVLKEPST